MPAPQQQSGFALLLFMIVMIGFITAGFSGLLTSSVKQQNEQAKINTRQALLQAKEALLSYAVDYRVQNKLEKMGKLPCPDVVGGANNNGNQDSICGTARRNAIGYFPYKTVGLGKLEDGNNECLWYVVSGSYKNNPEYPLLNWDTQGYLNLEDENGNLLHPSNADNFPVAFIISPGASLGQNRSPAIGLEDCKASYSVASYLEGGTAIDYSTDLPDTDDTVWKMITASSSSELESKGYNDHIIAVYRDELWERIKQIGDLDTSVSTSAIYNLTSKLATCLSTYLFDSSNSNNNLPFPAVLSLVDYENSVFYKDETGRVYGRFPQDISKSELLMDVISDDTHYVSDGAGTAFCGLTNDEEKFWENWKNNFYYILASNFKQGNTDPLVSKCSASGSCLEIAERPGEKFAAIVFFAKEKSIAQNDRALLSAVTDQEIWDQFLDGMNQTLYLENDATNDFSKIENDYAFCLVKSGATISVEPC